MVGVRLISLYERLIGVLAGADRGHGTVLDRDHGGRVKLLYELQRGVGVIDVVVGRRPSRKLTGTGERALLQEGFMIHAGALVRVFAVAHIVRLFIRHRVHLGEGNGDLVRKVLRHERIVTCRVGERLVHEVAALVLGDGARRKVAENAVIVIGIADDDGMQIILGRSIQERHAVAVDVRGRFPEGNACFHILHEGIEIDDDELDGIDLLVVKFGELLLGQFVGDDARIDGGMQRTHLAAQRLGIARQLMRGDGLDARFGQRLARPLRRDDLIAVFDEVLAELNDTFLVVHTHIRSFLAVHDLILS